MKKKVSKKSILIMKLRMAGYHQGSHQDDLSRIRVEYSGRMKWEDMKSHYIEGVKMRENGVPCDCYWCDKQVKK